MSRSPGVTTRPPPAVGISPRRPTRRLSPVGQAIARASDIAARAAAGFVRPPTVRPQRGYDTVRPDPDAADRGASAVMAAIAAHIAAAPLRADGRATRIRVGAAFVKLWKDSTGLICGGHERIGEIAGRDGPRIPRSTVGNHVRAFEAAGVIQVVQRGCSAAIAGRNIAPVYAVLTPAAPADADVLPPEQQAILDRLRAELAAMDEVDGHLSVDVGDRGSRKEPSLARKTGEICDEKRGPQRREQPHRYAPRDAGERRAAVEWIAVAMGWRPTPRVLGELAKVAAPFFAHGWSAWAVRAALYRRPDGARVHAPLPDLEHRDKPGGLRIRNRWAVLTHRLAAWRAPDGTPAAPPVPAEAPARGRPPRPRPPAAPPARTRPPAAALAAWAAAGLVGGALRDNAAPGGRAPAGLIPWAAGRR